MIKFKTSPKPSITKQFPSGSLLDTTVNSNTSSLSSSHSLVSGSDAAAARAAMGVFGAEQATLTRLFPHLPPTAIKEFLKTHTVAPTPPDPVSDRKSKKGKTDLNQDPPKSCLIINF